MHDINNRDGQSVDLGRFQSQFTLLELVHLVDTLTYIYIIHILLGIKPKRSAEVTFSHFQNIINAEYRVTPSDSLMIIKSTVFVEHIPRIQSTGRRYAMSHGSVITL